MKQPVLNIEVTPYKNHLRLYTDEAKYIAAVKEYDPNMDEERVQWCQGQCTSCQDGALIVGYFNGGLEVLVHELTHAVFYIFERVRTEASAANSEPFCYLLEHLTKECLNALKEKTRKPARGK